LLKGWQVPPSLKTQKMYNFPSALPADSPADVWSLQQLLLSEAEAMLGPRDGTKTICQPQFRDGPPQVINTPSLDGAFAYLSRNASQSWPVAIYELAHESVHLLNPTIGPGNYLEEGVAVAFSIEMAKKFVGGYFLPPEGSSYRHALDLLSRIPDWNFDQMKAIRSRFGSFSAATPETLEEVLPNVASELASDLCQLMRWAAEND
jgi:hypothetical protein